MADIVDISPRFMPGRKTLQSQYEKYPLPFFNGKTRNTWDVTPTGDYGADCRTGRQYAVEFIKSCDGTYGWTSLLQCVVADMIRAGTAGTHADWPSEGEWHCCGLYGGHWARRHFCGLPDAGCV